jgi:hypothetical protein
MENKNPAPEFSNEIPTWILDAISEHSPDGFVLFCINDDGDVELYKSAMKDVIEAGLREKALKILNTLNIVESNDMITQIIQQDQADDEEGSDEDAEPESF